MQGRESERICLPMASRRTAAEGSLSPLVREITGCQTSIKSESLLFKDGEFIRIINNETPVWRRLRRAVSGGSARGAGEQRDRKMGQIRSCWKRGKFPVLALNEM